ncbi:hypothetical protein BRD17_00725 [Halobacteriales archaeon SW_7_68_16]|nr:MAG: hypothetical protein BRD17_00725 [Halobacteriales archaeon SW_7_68_16]
MARDTTTIRVARSTKAELDEVKQDEELGTHDAAVRHLLRDRDARDLRDLIREAGALTDAGPEGDRTVSVQVIDEDDQPPLQPVELATLREVDIHCPACESTLVSLSLSDGTPIVPEGPVGSLSVACTTCGTERHAHTLVAVDTDREFDGTVVRRGMTTYWDEHVFDGDIDPVRLAFLAQTCLDVARENGWPWRPSLSTWTETAGLDAIVADVAAFLGDATGVRVEPGEPGDHGVAEWHLRFPSDADGAVGTARDWLTGWLADESVAVETVDATGGVVLALAGAGERARAGESAAGD